MNTIGHGVDLVLIGRIAQTFERHGDRFLQRVFTPAEASYCMANKRKTEHLAGRFAAKEAILKALGIGWRGSIAWTDMEIVNNAYGQPEVSLAGATLERAAQLGVSKVLVSISHTEEAAMASAIALGE
jgi:holo-[acyl-carrier protein] synthase